MKSIEALAIVVVVLLAGCVVPTTPVPIEQASVSPGFAHPEVLVDTAWVAENLQKTGVRLVDVSNKPEVYAEGHIPGAVYVNWQSDLTNPDDPVKGQIITGLRWSCTTTRTAYSPREPSGR